MGNVVSLVEMLKRGDRAAFNEIYELHYLSVRFYADLMLDADDAEDVVQELFLTLWNNRKKIEIGENVSGYLYRMAKNLVLNHIRTETNYRSVLESREEPLSYYEENPLESEEFRLALNDCINRLPGRCKEVLLLHRVKGLKQKEIADQLSISVKTIKNQIWSSLQRLKRCLELKGV